MMCCTYPKYDAFFVEGDEGQGYAHNDRTNKTTDTRGTRVLEARVPALRRQWQHLLQTYDYDGNRW